MGISSWEIKEWSYLLNINPASKSELPSIATDPAFLSSLPDDLEEDDFGFFSFFVVEDFFFSGLEDITGFKMATHSNSHSLWSLDLLVEWLPAD
jgi:hypothetical protein